MAVTAPAIDTAIGRRWAPSPRLVLAAVVLLALLSRYVILAAGGWTADDNIYLELAQQQGFGFHWLFSVQSTHWEPAVRAIFSIQNHLMPFDYRWGLVLMLVVYGASVLVFERIVRLLVGGTWVPVLAAGFMAFSVFGIESLQWWTSGIEALPSILCQLVCIYAFLRYADELSWRWLVISAGALTAGLLFYEHSVFVLMYLGLVRVFLLSGERLDPRAIGRALWRERWIWVALIGVGVCWAVVYARAGGFSASTEKSASGTLWLDFFRAYWVQTIAPGMFGVAFNTSRFGEIAGASMAVAIAMQVVLVTLAFVSVLRRPAAWRAWAVLLVCVLANGIPVGLDRLPMFGPAIGSHLRYSIDFAWLTPLLVCLAFVKPRALPTRTQRESRRTQVPGLALLATVLALSVAYIAVSTATASKLESRWFGRDARTWETNVSRVEALARPGRPVVVANDVVPASMAAFATPLAYNNLAGILPHYVGTAVHVDGALTGPLVMIDRVGRPHPATITPLRRLPVPRCSPDTRAGARLAWPMAGLARSSRYYLWFAYDSTRSTTAELLVDDGMGLFAAPQQYIGLAAGRHASIGWLGTGSPRGIVLEVPRAAGCVTGARLVTLS